MPTPKRARRNHYAVTETERRERDRVLAVLGTWRRYVATHVQHADKHLTVQIIDKISKEVESGYDPHRDRKEVRLAEVDAGHYIIS